IQEKRGMLKKWNLALIIGSWLLSIFGTFITRSGVISSVHSFTQSNVGYFFLFFLLVAGTASFTLYATRLPLLAADTRLESMVSREASFLFNNLLFVGIAFSVLSGTLFAILSQLVRGTGGQQSARGTPARARQYGEPFPLALGRLIARNRRRYGGYIVHSGIVMLFVAFSGMAFKTETEATLRPGESVSLRSPYGSTY